MAQNRAAITRHAKVMVYLGFTVLVAGAQSNCPTVVQLTGLNGVSNTGLLNGAKATIEVVGASLQTGDSMILAAANKWAAIPGATYTFTIQNVDSVPSGTASASNPVIIFEFGTSSQFAPTTGTCPGADMCTSLSSIDSAGHPLITKIDFNPALTTSNQFFQRDFDHELGHGAFGLGDCQNCDNSVSIMATRFQIPRISAPNRVTRDMYSGTVGERMAPIPAGAAGAAAAAAAVL